MSNKPCVYYVHFVVVIRDVTTIDSLYKETNQRKYSRSLGLLLADYPVLLTKNRRHRKVANAPPSRFSVLCCAARLREMAKN